MIQLRTSADPLEEITKTIVDGVHPRRVILIGSRARGDERPDSDYDVVVELDVPSEQARDWKWRIHDLVSRPGWYVDIHLRRPGAIERRRDDPGTVDWDIAREGKVLYREPSLPLEPWEIGDSADAARVRERPAVPYSLRGWIEFAKADLLTIKNNVDASLVPWGPVCFHAQQAGEKLLKALLIQRWERPERTHDLVKLLQACRAAGAALMGLDADCALLSTYAVDPRYPDDREDPFAPPPPPPTEEEGRAAVAAMRRIVDAIEPLLSA